MNLKKYLISALLVGTLASLSVVRADDFADMKTALNQSIATLIAKYEAQIQALQTENQQLKNQIASLQSATGGTTASTGTTTPTVTTPSVVTPVATTSAGTGVYAQIVAKINANLANILSENNLAGYSTIGLFEFINSDAFFMSLDDGNNPAGVTAFKTKILYKYDSALNLTKIGVFDLDYASQKYRTISGSNPYAGTTRTRVPNPGYKGKLLDATTATTSPTTTPTTTTTTTVAPTLANIQAAYNSNKILNALTLSDQYILSNPNDVTVLIIRYRSYYIVGKYDNSLAEIKKIEAIQGANFDRTIACDASVIAKISKNTTASTYYSAICKK